MNFSRISDYKTKIEVEELNLILELDDTIRIQVEKEAEAEVISHLRQRYDIKKIFLPMLDYSTTYTYQIGQRALSGVDIYYTVAAPAFDSTITYALKNRVNYLIPSQQVINVYECIFIPPAGTLPTNPIYFIKIDAVANVSTIPVNAPLSDTTNWAKGDNRDGNLIRCMIDIVLYHLCPLNPRFLTEYRAIRYNGNTPKEEGGAVGWLKQLAEGKVSIDAPTYANTDQGNAIVWGSGTKHTHYY